MRQRDKTDVDKNIVKQNAIKEHGLNALQAALLGVPVVGASFERLLFGHAAEARMKRIETTLMEVAQRLAKQGAAPPIDENEDLANLIEQVIPALGRATSETKRAMFRELLCQASTIPANDPQWEEANLAAKTIEGMTPFALEVVAAVHRCTTPEANACCIRYNETKHQHEVGLMNHDDEFSIANPFVDQTPIVVLTRQPGYIVTKTLDDLASAEILSHSGSFRLFRDVILQDLGEVLVDWAMEDDSPDEERS